MYRKHSVHEISMLEIPRAGRLVVAIVFDNVPWARQLLSEDPGVVHEYARRDMTP